MKRLNKVGFVRTTPLVVHEPQRADESPEAYAERAAADAEYDGITVSFTLLPGDTVIDWHDDIVESGLRIADAERALRAASTPESISAESYATVKAARQVVRAAMEHHRLMLRKHLMQALRGVQGLGIGDVDLSTYDCTDPGSCARVLDEVEACEDRSLLARLEACVRAAQGPNARQKKVSGPSPQPGPGTS